MLSSGAGFIHHKESLGNALKIFFGNADALIPHGDAVAVLLLFAGKEDDLAGFAGFAGIVNKIGKHGQQKIFFIKDQLLLDTRGKGQAVLFQHGSDHRHHVPHDPAGITPDKGKVVLIQHHQIHELQRHGLQPLAFGVDKVGGHKSVLRIHFVAAKHIRIADNGGHGGFELMGEAGHKVFLLLGIAFQIPHFLLNGAGHGIEAQRQIAYLIQRFHLCPLLVLTGGNAVGGPIQCADGAGIKVGKDQHGGNADGHRKGMKQYKGLNLPVIQVRQCSGGKVSIQVIDRVLYGKHPGAFQNDTFIRIQQAVHKLALFRRDTLQEGIKAFIRSGPKGALTVIQGADSLIP